MIALDTGIDQQTLTFYDQLDGRKVARMPSGKVALIHYDQLGKVFDGEQWLVQLEHHDTYAVAYPIERIERRQETPVVTITAKKPMAAEPQLVELVAEDATAPEPVKREFVPPKGRGMPENFLRAEDRVAFFVDGANMDGASRDAGYKLDFFKVGKFLRAGASFRAAYYYVADFTQKDPLQIKFLDFLNHAGYTIRKKPVKVLHDDDGEEYVKANVDTEIVLDMVNTCDNWDVAFLLSGDSDFERCVDLLRSRGKRVYIMSSEGTLSRELRMASDQPVFYIEDYRDLLERDGS